MFLKYKCLTPPSPAFVAGYEYSLAVVRKPDGFLRFEGRMGFWDPKDFERSTFLDVPGIEAKCKELVQFARKNRWDAPTLVHWLQSTWDDEAKS